MTKRLFLAVRLPGSHVAAYAALIERSRERYPGAKWVPPENLHLTVRFFGDVDESAVQVLLDSLRDILSREAVFPLTFDGVVFAPPRRPPTMIWGLYADGGEYARLARRVGDSAAKLVTEPARHDEALPHVTLVRFKRPVSTTALPRIDRLDPFTVSSCTLFASELMPTGPIHQAIADIPFGAASSL